MTIHKRIKNGKNNPIFKPQLMCFVFTAPRGADYVDSKIEILNVLYFDDASFHSLCKLLILMYNAHADEFTKQTKAVRDSGL